MNVDNFTVKIDTTEAAKRAEVALKSLSVTIDEGIGGA